MSLRELLVEPLIYMPPERALEGLSSEMAERHASATVHSIAEIVAHMIFWQEWFIKRLRGEAVQMAPSAALGWPEVQPNSWPTLRDRFVRGLDEAAAIGQQGSAHLESPVTPTIEYPPLAQMTVRDALVHIATHNAHHMGQVITLRQVLGAWPPPAGSWTW
jgi:uncharacterized damage-inducible protein DinB